jgi:hypothetical protein
MDDLGQRRHSDVRVLVALAGGRHDPAVSAQQLGDRRLASPLGYISNRAGKPDECVASRRTVTSRAGPFASTILSSPR